MHDQDSSDTAEARRVAAEAELRRRQLELINALEEEPEWLRKQIEEANERWFNPRGFFGLFRFRTSTG